jgi:hypothetical protein
MSVLLILCAFPRGAYAEDNTEIDVEQEVCKSINIGNYSDIVYPGDVTINGENQYLYCQFENNEEALKNFSNQHENIIADISEMYSLEAFNSNDWEVYRDYLYQYMSDTAGYDNDGNQVLTNADEIMKIEQFFDIFENSFENEKIKNIVSSAQLKRSLVNDEEVALLLPTYSPLVEEFVEENAVIKDEIKNKQNLLRTNSRGASYAANWAVNPNWSKYAVFAQDCTNFASQIWEASGAKQQVYASEYSGWWHRTSGYWLNSQYVTTHTHSISWIRADTFARYIGVKYKTRDHKSFARSITQYEFIAYDRTGDGSWDHIGYITAKDNYIGSYGYYDYKVAQHSNNYHAWTSSSTNKWDTLGSSGYVYGW